MDIDGNVAMQYAEKNCYVMEFSTSPEYYKGYSGSHNVLFFYNEIYEETNHEFSFSANKEYNKSDIENDNTCFGKMIKKLKCWKDKNFSSVKVRKGVNFSDYYAAYKIDGKMQKGKNKIATSVDEIIELEDALYLRHQARIKKIDENEKLKQPGRETLDKVKYTTDPNFKYLPIIDLHTTEGGYC